MICEFCAFAADYGIKRTHGKCQGCDCHHEPIQGEPRLKLTPARVAKCEHCGREVLLNKDRSMRNHRPGRNMPRCPGSGVRHD